ncbi:unnamed protein product [Arctogadus glacialis]
MTAAWLAADQTNPFSRLCDYICGWTNKQIHVYTEIHRNLIVPGPAFSSEERPVTAALTIPPRDISAPLPRRHAVIPVLFPCPVGAAAVYLLASRPSSCRPLLPSTMP